MTTVAQNFAATREGIEAMRACVAETTEIRKSVREAVFALYEGDFVKGPAYTYFVEVWTDWDEKMTAEIQRLNDFAVLAEGLVQEQEQAETDRWRELFGMKERAPWADLIPRPPLN